MRIVPITVAVTMALFAGAAFAGPVMVKDQGFMKNAAQGSFGEVADGKMAAGKTKNAEVKAFAEMMVKDHGKAALELRGLAKKHNVGLPMGPELADQATSKAMSVLMGATFDKAYVASQVKAHEKAVALFAAEAKTGTVAEAKAWAAKMLPALKLHLGHAKALDAKLQK